MKILCLHGAGLNADLMKRQLQPITAALDPTYEFVFIDGDIERDAAPGVPEQMPGPFYSYYEGLESDHIRNACDLIDMIAEEEGPFEGFIGFSQGAAVGVSYMLDQAVKRPEEACPFRWSLLFSCVLAFSPDPSYLDFEFAMFEAQNERDKAKKDSWKPWKKRKDGDSKPTPSVKIPENKGTMLQSQTARLAFRDEYTALIKACVVFAETQGHANGLTTFDKVTARVTAEDSLIDGSPIPRLYHPLLTPARLSIPTVLCTGGGEFSESLRQSSLIRKFYDSSTTVNLEHRGGHEVPRDPVAIQAIISATKKAIEDSRWATPRALM